MRLVVSLALLALAYIAYAEGAGRSVLLDPVRAERIALAEKIAREGIRDDEAERLLAEAYWKRNPDVAESFYFGRAGRLGTGGAREHYMRHGRHEGRLWGAGP